MAATKTIAFVLLDELREQFPAVNVELDPIHVSDGNIWTSAGISAGVDLALTLVAVDHGRHLSSAVARDLVVFLHRPGGQAQFSRTLATQARAAARGTASQLEALHAWIAETSARRRGALQRGIAAASCLIPSRIAASFRRV